MIRFYIYFIALSAVTFLLTAGCENDIERVNLLTESTEIPRVKGTNIEVIYSDSAKVRVQIETRDPREIWSTIGVSENIIEASWQALADSVQYKLSRELSRPAKETRRDKKGG